MEGLPIQIPAEIFQCQAVLGPKATLVWINLAALAQLRQPLRLDTLAEQIGLAEQEVSRCLALLADRGGWINDEGGLKSGSLCPPALKKRPPPLRVFR